MRSRSAPGSRGECVGTLRDLPSPEPPHGAPVTGHISKPTHGSSLTDLPSCFSPHMSLLFRSPSRVSPQWCHFTGLSHTQALSRVPPHGYSITGAAPQASPHRSCCRSLPSQVIPSPESRQGFPSRDPYHRSPLTDLPSPLSLPRAPFTELRGLQEYIRGLHLTCLTSLRQPRRNEVGLSHLCALDFNAILSDLPESVMQVQPAHSGRGPREEGPCKG